MSHKGQTVIGDEGVLTAEEAAELAALIKVVGSGPRVEILSWLGADLNRDWAAVDFIALLGLSQPTVAHHIGILRKAGLVECEKDGVYTVVRRNDAAVSALADRIGQLGQRKRRPRSVRA